MALGAESDLARPVRPELHQATVRYLSAEFIRYSVLPEN
jgi:hypothetical protein